MDKTALAEQMKVIQATAFSIYLKAHNYHWNVTGPNFSEYHEFFSDFYTAVFDSVDVYAEHIRSLGVYAPGSFKRFSELSLVADEVAIPASKFMFTRLAADNLLFIEELKKTCGMAEELGERGLLNTLEGQLTFHEKMQWQLTAFAE